MYRFHFDHSFSHSDGDQWENIFPSFTTYNELALVDGLIRYNPKKRLTAKEVHSSLYNKLY